MDTRDFVQHCIKNKLLSSEEWEGFCQVRKQHFMLSSTKTLILNDKLSIHEAFEVGFDNLYTLAFDKVLLSKVLEGTLNPRFARYPSLQFLADSGLLTVDEIVSLPRTDKGLLSMKAIKPLIQKVNYTISQVREVGSLTLAMLSEDESLLVQVIEGSLDARLAFCPPLQALVTKEEITLEAACSFSDSQKRDLSTKAAITLLEKKEFTVSGIFQLGRHNLKELSDNPSLLAQVMAHTFDARLAFCPPLQELVNQDAIKLDEVFLLSAPQKFKLRTKAARVLLAHQVLNVSEITEMEDSDLSQLSYNPSLMELVLQGKLDARLASSPSLQYWLNIGALSIEEILSCSELEKHILMLDATKVLVDKKIITIPQAFKTGRENLEMLTREVHLLEQVIGGTLDVRLAYFPGLQYLVDCDILKIDEVLSLSRSEKYMLEEASSKKLLEKKIFSVQQVLGIGRRNLSKLSGHPALLEKVIKGELDARLAEIPSLQYWVNREVLSVTEILSLCDAHKSILGLSATKVLFESKRYTIPQLFEIGYHILTELSNKPAVLSQVISGHLDIRLVFFPSHQYLVDTGECTVEEVLSLPPAEKKLLGLKASKVLIEEKNLTRSQAIEVGSDNLNVLSHNQPLLNRVLEDTLDMRLAYCPLLQQSIDEGEYSTEAVMLFSDEQKKILGLNSTQTLIEQGKLTVQQAFEVGYRNLLQLNRKKPLLEQAITGSLDAQLACTPSLQYLLEVGELTVDDIIGFSDEQRALLSLSSTVILIRNGKLTVTQAFEVGYDNLLALDDDESLLAQVVDGTLDPHLACYPFLQYLLDSDVLPIDAILALTEAEQRLFAFSAAKTLLESGVLTAPQIIEAGYSNLSKLNRDKPLLLRVLEESLDVRLAFCPSLQYLVDCCELSVDKILSLTEEQRKLLALNATRKLITKGKLTVPLAFEVGFDNLLTLEHNPLPFKLVLKGNLAPHLACRPSLQYLVECGALLAKEAMALTEVQSSLLALSATQQLIEAGVLTVRKAFKVGYRNLSKLSQKSTLLTRVLEGNLDPRLACFPSLQHFVDAKELSVKQILSMSPTERKALRARIKKVPSQTAAVQAVPREVSQLAKYVESEDFRFPLCRWEINLVKQAAMSVLDKRLIKLAKPYYAENAQLFARGALFLQKNGIKIVHHFLRDAIKAELRSYAHTHTLLPKGFMARLDLLTQASKEFVPADLSKYQKPLGESVGMHKYYQLMLNTSGQRLFQDSEEKTVAPREIRTVKRSG